MKTVIVNVIVLLSSCCASSFKSGVKTHCGVVYKASKHHLHHLDPPREAWILGELVIIVTIVGLMNNLGNLALI